ncbi:MAG: TrkA C-terminal domain-containing protein [Clostridium baratii]|uniref:TrkA-C domain protein n=1 Tax=Clostridium baratii str. Sullivan TaxID=1415775 RepID=A0A0A7FUJ6_9CLOT|nr:TrkA C-terminal domain-containing protein [Clostridium baratii]AIY82620.1 trkA-C domain protein [Clostridium baratii str. Sullivan]MBS6007139.1 TrkA C-terminal domain-containing protein [Clostridium baratii]MDU1054105.1 TrkA C-terminal domain-containing protein [Clostridium baratii]MDU4911018.1 TrkA C-terminal domain-containing protein [Clostridium baratii]CUP50632.1 TrkA domain-containing protein [Clostridium baratii]
MGLILTFLMFGTIFIVVVNICSILLRLTGMPIKKARFQVVSLLTSTGFTTRESEMVVQHPVRRKIASWLMIVSYVSTATFISFFVTMISDTVTGIGFFVVIAALVTTNFVLRRTKTIERLELKLENVVLKSKIWEKLNSENLTLITNTKGYGIYQIYLPKNSKIIGKSILESGLKDLEIEVLNIDKGDKFIKFASPDYVFEVFDRVTVYGNLKNIRNEFEHVIK